MNPITLFLTILCALAGVGLWELGVPVVGAIFIVAAVIILLPTSMVDSMNGALPMAVASQGLQPKTTK